jgi:hypothetical protein
MTSSINTTSIDETFPIAGQDNDSQGFRDNFNNIKNNFGVARDEISALLLKVTSLLLVSRELKRCNMLLH